jgi:hypothetical protein
VNHPLLTFECLIQSLWNLVCISWHLSQSNSLLNISLTSGYVSVCVSLLSLLGKDYVKCISPVITRQRLGNHILAATNTRNNRKIVRRVVFNAVRVLSKESLWVSIYTLLFLGNNSVKTFPRQRRIVGGIVLCAVRVVLKEWKKWVPQLLVSYKNNFSEIGLCLRTQVKPHSVGQNRRS